MSSSNVINKSENLPSPPFIHVANVPNFRDLGSYAVAHSPKHSIRQKFVYRCAEPSRVTPHGVSTLRSLGITHVFDLRSAIEVERTAAREGLSGLDGCERVFVPVFSNQYSNAEHRALRYNNYASGSIEGFTLAYADILEQAPPSYKQILLHLANKPSNPLIVHCSAGKDRTGVICALILSLCGVDDETVAYEYSLTEIGLAKCRQAILANLAANPAFQGGEKGVENMASARAANMLSTLKMIREKYGGAEGYVTGKCGLTHEDIANIRANMVVEASPIEHLAKQDGI